MTTKVGVQRCFRGSGGMGNTDDYAFVSRPATEATVLIGELAEGTVQRVEHVMAPGTPPNIVIFNDR